MKCEEIGDLLPDYLQGSLKAERDSLVEQHLTECADCREVRSKLEHASKAATMIGVTTKVQKDTVNGAKKR